MNVSGGRQVKSQVLFFPLLISCLISPFVSDTGGGAGERARDFKSIGAKANVIKGEREASERGRIKLNRELCR